MRAGRAAADIAGAVAEAGASVIRRPGAAGGTAGGFSEDGALGCHTNVTMAIE